MNLFARARNELRRLFAKRYKTMFGTARVYVAPWGDTQIRVLDVDDTYQSATFLDEYWCVAPFPYLMLYGCVFDIDPPVRNLCMLGGGGYAFPKYVVAYHPEARIDVVEIDPAITRIACEDFFLDRLIHTYHTDENGRLGLVCDDGLAYLHRCAQGNVRYDAILNDCFAAGTPEAALTTPEALRTVRACLTPTGLYLTNTIAALEGEESWPLVELVNTLSEVFAHVSALPCSRHGEDERDNMVVIASQYDYDIPDVLRLYDAL